VRTEHVFAILVSTTTMASQEVREGVANLLSPVDNNLHFAHAKQPTSDELRRYIDAQYAAHGKRTSKCTAAGINGNDYDITGELCQALVDDMMIPLTEEEMDKKYSFVRLDGRTATEESHAAPTESARQTTSL
ncbi:hypothetical protein LTR95_018242, partial [Oleoguttula sp. CCFEE 5521]